MRRGLFDPQHTSMVQLVETALAAAGEGKIPGCCAEDQSFLTEYVWPKIKQHALSHDIDQKRCKRYGSACHEYPLGPRDQDNYYFVGSTFKEPKRFTYEKSGHNCSLVCDKIL